MLLVHNESLDPYYNLALEEFLFKAISEDCFMLWRNDDAVVVGKHQNVLKEVDVEFAGERGVKVARRLSGGGTVYHDTGNVNFTLIMTRESDKVVDFKRYMTPIYEALRKLGLPVEFSERHDLLIEGKKISGNAEHAVKNKVLHHGTLLYSSDLRRLNNSIRKRDLDIVDKSVPSVRSKVTNISDYLESPMSVESFITYLEEAIKNYFPNIEDFKLTDDDAERVEQLKSDKYESWDWIIGYAPKFTITSKKNQDEIDVSLTLTVKKGLVEEVKVVGLNSEETERIIDTLVGSPHQKIELSKRFNLLLSNGVLPKALVDHFIHTLI